MKPLNTPIKLAGNPQSVPHYKTSIKTPMGILNVSDPQALRALISLMDMEAVIGGAASHFGGPSALAELVSVVHGVVFDEAHKLRRPWYEMFNVINDIGHCENIFYALKANYGFADLTFEDLRGFRSITSPLTGHGESHLFPEGVLLSNGPLGSAFPQTQGLSAADKLAHRERTTVCFISDGACMEGEAKESLAAIPGLAAKNMLNPYVLIISDNNTKLSGRIDKDAFSMEPTFKSMTALGWKVIPLEKAHDLEACAEAFVQALHEARANPSVPVAIQAKTVKGYGIKKLFESASGGHGFPLKKSTELNDFMREIFGSTQMPVAFTQWTENLTDKEKGLGGANEPGEKIQKGVASALIEAAKKGYPILSVTSDLPGSTGLADFRKEFPHHSIDVGVAESNMISMA
ncbi:MAG: thiamine pyrophosphate-dependent enzyme, partial [Bdellovibrionota bacterium]